MLRVSRSQMYGTLPLQSSCREDFAGRDDAMRVETSDHRSEDSLRLLHTPQARETMLSSLFDFTASHSVHLRIDRNLRINVSSPNNLLFQEPAW